MRNARLDEAQAGIKIAGRNISNLRHADDTTLMSESKEELKSLMMKMKEKSEKAGLKLHIQKTKIMASGPITSWKIDGKTIESERLYFLGLQDHSDGDCSHEIQSHLLLGRKAMTNLDSILKNRDITLLIEAHLVKAMVFPVVMYRCEELDYKESWGTKNWRFWTVVMEKTLESPLNCKEIKSVNTEGNQPQIFIERTDAEAEAPILRPPDVKSWLIGKRLCCWER